MNGRTLGIGVDIVEVERIATAIGKFGERFIQRIYRPEEIRYCQSFKHSAPHWAARFAAKEAIAKAFGTGIGRTMNWLDMEIGRRDSGEPFVILHGAGQHLLAERGGAQVLVSLSHTRQYAVAVATIVASAS